MYRAKPLAERLYAKLDQSGGPDACWPYMRFRDKDGYGFICIDGGRRQRRTHRVAYELAFGPIPPGQFVCHRCDNPPCCNPAHLFLGTLTENNRDKVAKGRGAMGERNGRYTHPENTARGARHGRSKFTPEQVREIRQVHTQGTSYSTLAARFGVNKSSIARICRGEHWAHLSD